MDENILAGWEDMMKVLPRVEAASKSLQQYTQLLAVILTLFKIDRCIRSENDRQFILIELSGMMIVAIMMVMRVLEVPEQRHETPPFELLPLVVESGRIMHDWVAGRPPSLIVMAVMAAMVILARQITVKMESNHEAIKRFHQPSQATADYSPQETLEALGQSHGPSNATPSKKMSDPAFEWHVLGKLNGKPVEAFADTGADCNAISASCADERHLRPDPGSTRARIRLPSGKSCKSLGMTTLQFQFDGEDEVHNVHCNIVPKLQRECVLALGFLRTTETLTKFKSRLKEVPLPEEHRMSLGLMRDGAVDRDSNNSAINGYVAGAKCLAIPDSGSSIMALSGSHVRSLQLRIDTRKRCKVKFIDGSSAWTSGTVTASWQFSSSRIPFWNTLYSMLCYLLLRPPALLPLARRPWTVQVWHVIEDMDDDAILSIDFIKEHDIFRAYESSFVKRLKGSLAAKIYGICSCAYPKGNKRPETLASSFYLDIQSPKPFSYDMLVREDARRSEIEDAIASLAPGLKAEAARSAEIQRRQFWDDLKQQQELRDDAQQQQGAAQRLGESTTPDTSSSAPSAHATAPPPKRRRQRFWLRNWR